MKNIFFDFLFQMIHDSVFKAKIYFWIAYSSAHGPIEPIEPG